MYHPNRSREYVGGELDSTEVSYIAVATNQLVSKIYVDANDYALRHLHNPSIYFDIRQVLSMKFIHRSLNFS